MSNQTLAYAFLPFQDICVSFLHWNNDPFVVLVNILGTNVCLCAAMVYCWTPIGMVGAFYYAPPDVPPAVVILLQFCVLSFGYTFAFALYGLVSVVALLLFAYALISPFKLIHDVVYGVDETSIFDYLLDQIKNALTF